MELLNIFDGDGILQRLNIDGGIGGYDGDFEDIANLCCPLPLHINNSELVAYPRWGAACIFNYAGDNSAGGEVLDGYTEICAVETSRSR